MGPSSKGMLSGGGLRVTYGMGTGREPGENDLENAGFDGESAGFACRDVFINQANRTERPELAASYDASTSPKVRKLSGAEVWAGRPARRPGRIWSQVASTLSWMMCHGRSAQRSTGASTS